ncbi:putative toxin-antitoxin system toxin component, PIN family [Mucilaginibacter sp. PAMC 26640]|nr:putative toxin-antitoxin system toxin component, PIN family [Mucilaginibacter sp. PAMC 26640]
MANNSTRIILDTNLWISFLITKNVTKIDALLLSDEVTILFSEELLSEFLEVSLRQKFRKYFDIEQVTLLISAIDKSSETIQIKSQVDVCRDKKDNFLLALAIDGNADYLVTGDSDLLDLKTHGLTRNITMADFLKQPIS